MKRGPTPTQPLNTNRSTKRPKTEEIEVGADKRKYVDPKKDKGKELLHKKRVNKRDSITSSVLPLTTPLDLRMFAHILNDLDLSGSPLQGTTFTKTITYFDDFLSRFIENQIDIKGISPQRLRKLKDECERMKGLFSQLRDDAQRIEAITEEKDLELAVQYIIEQLQVQERVFIPGGWIGSPGHAMLYECRRDGRFLIWNTGAGLNTHLGEETPKGKTYHVVKAYQIPNIDTQMEKLKISLISILQPKIKALIGYKANMLYNLIDDELIFLNAKEIDPTPFVKEMIQGQFSGTCAWQVIASLVRNYEVSEWVFEEMHYEIMRDTLIKAIKTLNLENYDPAVYSQFSFAIKNFALLLQSLAKKGVVSNERQEDGIDLIKNIDKIIKSSLPAEMAQTPVLSLEKPQFKSRRLRSWDDDFCTFKNRSNKDKILYYPPHRDSQINDFKQLMHLISDALNQKPSSPYLVNHIKNVENIFNDLPLTDSFWEECLVEDILQCVGSLEQLTLKYCQLCQSLDRFSFAERIIAVYSVIALMKIFTDKLFGAHSACSLAINASKEHEETKRTFECLKRMDGNAFFSITTHPLAKRYQEIYNILSSSSISEQSGISAIASLSSELKKEALLKGVPYAVPECEIPGFYYFLNKSELQNRFPEIEQLMQFNFSCIKLKAFGVAITNDNLAKTQDKLPENKWDEVSIETDDHGSWLELHLAKVCSKYYKNNYLCQTHIIKNKSIKQDLQDKRTEPNLIQLLLHSQILSPTIDLRRRLRHLRSEGNSQVVAATELLKSYLSQLQDPDVQKCIFLAIFQGGYLNAEIIENPGSIHVLLDCIENGIKLYQPKKAYVQVMFFYQMNTFLYQYLQSYSEECIHRKNLILRTEVIDKEFQSFMQILKIASKSPQELDVWAHGLHLRIISLSVQLQYKCLDQKLLSDFFVTQLLFNQVHAQHIDPFITKETDLALDVVKCAISSGEYNVDFTDAVVNEMLLNINVINTLAIEGKFPSFRAGEYSINVVEGTVSHSGNSMTILPKTFYKNPAFAKLFLTHSILARKINDKMYTFTYENEEYRIKGDFLGLKIQKLIELEQQLEWMQYVENPNYLFMHMLNGKKSDQGRSSVKHILPHTNSKTRIWKIDESNLPHTLGGETRQVWKTKIGPKNIIKYAITHPNSNKIAYCNDGESVLKFNEKGEPAYKLMHINSTYEFLTRFEDPRFIEIWQDLNTNQIHIHFARYSLNFYSQVQDDSLIYRCEEIPGYALVSNPTSLMPRFNSVLELAPMQNCHDPILYLVPKQEFIATNNHEEDFYQVVLDIYNEVNVFNKYAEANGKGPTDELRLAWQNQPSRFLFSNQEKYAVLAKDGNGELKANTAADNFYLATLYFAQRQPDKAFKLLKRLVHSWNGEPEIQEYLVRILENIPTNTINKNLAEKAKNNGPEYVAVRTLVCYLISVYYQKIEADIIKESDKLKLKKAIVRHLSTYFSMKDKIPRSLRLSQDEILVLISFAKSIDEVYGIYTISLENSKLTLNYLKGINAPTPLLIKADDDNLWIYGDDIDGHQKLTRLNLDHRLLGKLKFEVKGYSYFSVELVPLSVFKAIKHANGHEPECNFPFHFQLYHKNKKVQHRENEFIAIQSGLDKALSQSTAAHRAVLSVKLNKAYTLFPAMDQIYTSAKQAEISSVGDYNLQPKLSISDLCCQTNVRDVGTSLIALFQEAMANNHKLEILHNYLDKKIKSLLKYTSTIEPLILQTILLLKLMLSNPAKTQEVFLAGQKPVYTRIESLQGTMYYNQVREIGIVYTLFLVFEKEVCAYELTKHRSILNHVKQTRVQSTISHHPEIPHSSCVIREEEEEEEETEKEKENKNKKQSSYQISTYPEETLFVTKETEQTFVAMMIDEANKDHIEGKQLNQRSQSAQTEFAMLLLDNEYREGLSQKLKADLEKYQFKCDDLRNKLEFLANHGPDELSEHLQWECGFYAKSREKIEINDLLKYFAKYSLAKICDKRKIDIAKMQQWHEMMIEYMTEGSACQKIRRAISLMEDMHKLNELQSQNKIALANRLAQTLTHQRVYEPKSHPFILLFEFQDNKLIFDIQYKILNSLLEKNDRNEYVSKVIQLIMGGGKSKVLLPLLAKLRPTGENLVIVEVTPELFPTNFADLSNTSGRIFDQKAHPFVFHRNIDCDNGYFYQLKEKLRSIIVNKEYIVTTRQSIDSLILKYILLLAEADVSNPGWVEDVKYLDEIVNILHNQADTIIDEVDSNLHPKDQLIYMVSEGKPLEKYLLKSLIELYQFSSQILFAQHENIQSLYDLITGKTERPSDEIQEELLLRLSSQLVFDLNSPIRAIVNKIIPQHHELLVKFFKNEFRNRTNHVPPFRTLDKHEREILALYKEELTRLLPITIQKDCNVHFGLSKDDTKDEIEREVAIPYAGNNVPVENARFQSNFLTTNYTIQIQYQKSLSEYVFNIFLHNFKVRLDVENTLNAYRSNKIRHVEREFKSIVPALQISLNDIDMANRVQISELYQKLKSDQRLKDYCLIEIILPSILSTPETLSANTQNHVSTFRSVIGFTGTDYNYRTFHPSIKRDNSISFGTDGQTLDHLLNQNSPVHLLTSSKVDALFNIMDAHLKAGDIRAIIDAGAQFKGIPNRDVANMLSAKYDGSEIKYILFFQENTLCALKTSSNPENEIAMVLGSSENVEQNLRCNANQYFSYYDQRHTTGIDIKQAANTIGLVTIGKDNTLRDLEQAAMRLRDLKGSHRAEFCVMNSLSTKHGDMTLQDWNIKSLLNITLHIQAKVLMKMHLSAAFQKLHNLFKEDGLARVRQCKTLSEKVLFTKAFHTLFFDIDQVSLFEKFAPPEMDIPLAELLKNFCNALWNKWLKCLNLSNVIVTSSLVQKMFNDCQEIIAQALTICEPMQKTSFLSQGDDNQVTTQNEAQNQNQNQHEQENERETEATNKMAKRYVSWKTMANKWQHWNPKTSKIVCCRTLESLVQQCYPLRNWEFSQNILVSENFFNTVMRSKSDLNNTFKKPCYYVMVLHQGDMYTHIMITQVEAAELRELLPAVESSLPYSIWIETPGGIPYFNLHEPKSLSSSYHRQREQILFFNGDINYLAANAETLFWLTKLCQEKLDFLQNAIVPYHPSKSVLMPTLRNMLQPAETGVDEEEEEVLEMMKPRPLFENSFSLRKLYSVSTTLMDVVASAVIPDSSHMTPIYDSVDAVQRADDLAELDAFKEGLDSSNWMSRILNMGNMNTFMYAEAYNSGTKFSQHNSVLKNEVGRRRKKLLS